MKSLDTKSFPLATSCLLALGVIVGCKSVEENRPTWLPQSAPILYRRYEGKYAIKLKAKVSEPEFIQATKELNLTSPAQDKEYPQNTDALRWTKGPDKKWDPSPAAEGTLICHHYNLWELVKYENGYLYYMVLNTDMH
jgi:hypothetical protein